MKQEDWNACMRGEPLPAFTAAAVPEASESHKKPIDDRNKKSTKNGN